MRKEESASARADDTGKDNKVGPTEVVGEGEAGYLYEWSHASPPPAVANSKLLMHCEESGRNVNILVHWTS